jgi:uncharacterized protein (DUF983 family)
MRHTRLTTLPHEFFGASDCCGCLSAVTRGDEADITCGECGAIIRTIRAGDVEGVLTEMELSLDVLSEQCPHCKGVNVISGFSGLLVYTCRNCGEVVRLSDHADVQRFFGPDTD